MIQLLQRSIELSYDAGLTQVVVAIFFGALTIAAVILRLVSRRISKVSLGMNDWMIIFALIMTICSLSAIITGVVRGGAGKHQAQLSKHEITVYWKSNFVIYITWPITQTAIKISILLFYSNLFITRNFLIAAYTTIAVVCVWCVEQVAASLLLCRPISYNWNTDQEGHCRNIMANCLAGAAINVSTDLVILVLPVPVIWGLNIPLKSKLSISFIFGLGFLICIISIIRFRGLVYWTTDDGTYKNTMAILWTSLESMLGVICACIVVMRPLFRKLFPPRLPKKAPPHSSRTPSDPVTGPPQPIPAPRNNFLRFDEAILPPASSTRGHMMTPSHTTIIEVTNNRDASNNTDHDLEAQYPAQNLSRGAIMVKREWEVDSEKM